MRTVVDSFTEEFPKTGQLKTRDFSERSNITDEWSNVLTWKAPKGDAYLLRSDMACNILIPAKETISHGGGTETHELSHRLVENVGLSDEQTVFVDDESASLESVDYDDNEIEIDASEDDYDVYYLVGDGTVRIVYEPPVGLGSAQRNLFDKSLASVNSVDQFDAESRITLSRSWIIWEAHLLKVQVKTSATIAFAELKYPKVGQINIPYRTAKIAQLPDELIHAITQRVTRIN